jgi:hypothetical protein
LAIFFGFFPNWEKGFKGSSESFFGISFPSLAGLKKLKAEGGGKRQRVRDEALRGA